MENKILPWPLMKDCITEEDKQSLVDFIQTSNRYTNGPKVKQFEQEWSEWLGVRHSLFVSSGSTANFLLLSAIKRGYNLKKGDKVLVPAMTWVTNIAPVIQLGLKPIFCDVNLTSYIPDIEDIIALIDDDVKAIMVPNLIGNKPNWKLLKEELIRLGRTDIFVIEDSADTMTYTEETDIATTSFYASHVITAGGQGGMVMFNSEEHRDKALQYRDWGRMGDNSELIDDRFNHSVDGIPYDHKFLYSVLGYNMKCSEMNAAFGLVQLERFETFEKVRRANFERYLENLKDVPEITLPDDSIKPNWLAVPLQTERRLELLTFLEEQNIQTRVTFAGNVTRHPIYREYLQEFKNSDTIMANGFLTPFLSGALGEYSRQEEIGRAHV